MKRWFKIYLITVLLMYIGGKIKSIIGGYRFFCDGWRSCDNDGTIIEMNTFISREINILVLILVLSIMITFLVLRVIDQTKKEAEKGN